MKRMMVTRTLRLPLAVGGGKKVGVKKKTEKVDEEK